MIEVLRRTLSASRLSTYELATSHCSTDVLTKAVQLYHWNANVSGCFLFPLQLSEVVIRNAVSDALVMVYGQAWPWSLGFERSLPDPNYGYSPRKDLQQARKAAKNMGQVIPELKFVFWQKMFTKRHDARIWQAHLYHVLPNLVKAKRIETLRSEIYDHLEEVRMLRNRIAHHEPIFKRNLLSNYLMIREIVNFRCELTASWLEDNQSVRHTLTQKPESCSDKAEKQRLLGV